MYFSITLQKAVIDRDLDPEKSGHSDEFLHQNPDLELKTKESRIRIKN